VPGESATSGGDRTAPQLDAAAFDAMFSDRRRSEDGRITALTAERDGLRGALEEHEQEIERLRQDVARGQTALEAQTREIHALRLGMAETVRQAEEIRKVLQALEGEIESAGRREAVLEEALEAERRQVREAVARAGQEQQALREDLADAENLLAEARKDIGADQGSIARLQRTLDEERAQGTTLREQLEAQTAELAHLHAAMQAVPTLLSELAHAFGGGAEPPKKEPGAEGTESGWLEALVSDPAASHADADALAIVQTVREALRGVLPPATGSDAQVADLATDPAELRRRAEQIADHWRRAVRKRGEPTRPEEPARREHAPLPEQGGTKKDDRGVPREGEAPPTAKQEPTAAPVASSSAGPKVLKRPGSPSGTTVECTFPASGTEAACVLRGEIARINDMGLLAAFEERLPEGAPMVVRFVRNGEVMACRARVVRVQESAGTSVAHASLHHLIRFESPVSASGESVRPSVG
jgi:predicted  nucleic acid-binding Zn-ribbon protein